ncbi:MAG: DUF1566 domain-containing protein [candidate division KSB1 bacterium]|nr:DUF1566 domain-containing protein [candidate division KSB1 bacterium]
MEWTNAISLDKDSAGRAWFVDFDYGYCYHGDIGDEYSIRAVRS